MKLPHEMQIRFAPAPTKVSPVAIWILMSDTTILTWDWQCRTVYAQPSCCYSSPRLNNGAARCGGCRQELFAASQFDGEDLASLLSYMNPLHASIVGAGLRDRLSLIIDQMMETRYSPTVFMKEHNGSLFA